MCIFCSDTIFHSIRLGHCCIKCYLDGKPIVLRADKEWGVHELYDAVTGTGEKKWILTEELLPCIAMS